MPLDFPSNTFFEDSGKNSARFGEMLRDGVVSFGCQLWSNFPGWLSNSKLPQNSWARGYLNEMCQDIQPPVPPPDQPFFGGQCNGVQYEVLQEAETFFNGEPRANQNSRHIVYGPIGDVGVARPIPNNEPRIFGFYVDGFDNLGNPRTFTTPIGGLGWTGNQISVQINREDGQPDNCGNPRPGYPPNEPTDDDRRTIYRIPNPDGLDLEIEIKNYDYSNYNFPMYFTVNGLVAVLDIGGLHFYSPDGGGDLDGDNILPPPSTKDDPPIEYPEVVPPVAPPLPIPRLKLESINQVFCNDGVLEGLTSLIPVDSATRAYFGLVINSLNEIVREICTEDELLVDVGLPEYYGLRPGAERPAIVYYWRTFSNDKWGRSTYTSTVHNPSVSAVENIANLVSFKKEVGAFKTYISLKDGSGIKATGNDKTTSKANFDWLLSQVNGLYIPNFPDEATIEAVDNRIVSRELWLRQIEYYPDGKADNASPSVRRRLKHPSQMI